MNCLILSEFSQVVKASDLLHKFGKEQQLETDILGQLELILVEAINNIIEHSYQGKPGGTINIDLNRLPDEIIITLQDEGLAVPDSVKDIKNEMPDETALPEGGWGLGLIQMLADRIEFSTEDSKNVLLLGKAYIASSMKLESKSL